MRREWPLLLSCVTTVLFLAFGKAWLADQTWLPAMFVWLFAAILVAAFAVVRHAGQLAIRFGEPLGTLILTLAMCGMEMMMIAAVMYSGHGSPTLARDTMLAVLMLVLNGLVGVSLLLGGLRYREQTYNLYGAKSFLAVLIPLAVLSLILPNFTAATPGPTYSPLQAAFLILMSAGLYITFLAIQTLRHREYFVAPRPAAYATGEATKHIQHDEHADEHGAPSRHSTAYHAVLLVAYALPIVLLAKQIAVPIDYLIEGLGAPAALGGLLVAVLILSPESMSAVKAALANQLQRSINLSLGTALSSISLTVPAVLIIGFLTGMPVALGLEPANMVLLTLTLVVSMLTFALEKTNALLGAVHLLLFCAYLMLMFDRWGEPVAMQSAVALGGPAWGPPPRFAGKSLKHAGFDDSDLRMFCKFIELAISVDFSLTSAAGGIILTKLPALLGAIFWVAATLAIACDQYRTKLSFCG